MQSIVQAGCDKSKVSLELAMCKPAAYHCPDMIMTPARSAHEKIANAIERAHEVLIDPSKTLPFADT